MNKEASHLKHPVSKEKLKVIDRFTGEICSACGPTKPALAIVESDLDSVKYYLVVNCDSCENTSWYIFPRKT